MELTIKLLGGETRVVNTTPTTTVGELKSNVASLLNTSPSRLKLSVTTDHIIHLNHDQKTMSDYGLMSGSILNLLIAPFQVLVKNVSGQINTYDVRDEETVPQLMEKIHNKEGPVVDQHRLIFNGKQLDFHKKLQDYNITPGSIIYMTARLRGG